MDRTVPRETAATVRYPLELSFKAIALGAKLSVTDADERLILFVKQKALKLKEAVTVFRDEEMTQSLATITADRVLDLSATYRIEGADGRALGALRRQGMRSIWKAHYELERDDSPVLTIREEKPWKKLLDGLLGEIPILGLLTGYLLHPAYIATRPGGDEPVLRVEKRPAFLESRFTIEKTGSLAPGEEALALLGVAMLAVLERGRG